MKLPPLQYETGPNDGIVPLSEPCPLYFMFKKLIIASVLTLGIGLVSTSVYAQKAAAPSGSHATTAAAAPSVKWDRTEYDFGNIPQNVPAIATFELTNTGKSPVVISNVVGSCGCTVPSWDKEPILTGKKSKITANYNAAAVGAFTKTVTVTLAGSSNPVVLTIKGTVAEKK